MRNCWGLAAARTLSGETTLRGDESSAPAAVAPKPPTRTMFRGEQGGDVRAFASVLAATRPDLMATDAAAAVLALRVPGRVALLLRLLNLKTRRAHTHTRTATAATTAMAIARGATEEAGDARLRAMGGGAGVSLGEGDADAEKEPELLDALV